MKELFSFKGRVGRQHYFAGTLLLVAVCMLLLGLIGYLSGGGNIDTYSGGFETQVRVSILIVPTGPLFWLYLCFYPTIQSEATSGA